MAGNRSPAAAEARAGVGWSEQANSQQAGVEAARMALERAGGIAPDLILVYQTSKQDPRAVHAGVRSVVGDGPRLVGGYAVGIVTNDYLDYEGHQVGVAALSVPRTRLEVISEEGLKHRERSVGVALGRRIREANFSEPPSLLLLYDAIQRPVAAGLALNMATPLIHGMAEGLEVTMSAWPTAAGVGMMGDMQWNETWQFLDDRVVQQTASVIALSGDVRMDTTIMHGCRPAGRYYTITKADGPVVLELEGRPALDVIDEMLGGGTEWADYPLFVTLGLKKGDPFDPEYREEEWANRLCMSVDHERRGLVLFEPDLVEGSKVQLMRRATDFSYVRERTRALFARLADEGRRPFFALYIDCAGRASAYCASDGEEADEVRAALGDVPLLGFYSGVEIAQVGGEMQALDWTGVLCVFSDGDPR